MKRIIMVLLATAGALSLAFWGVWSLGQVVAPGYEVSAAEQFGGATTIKELAALYARVENSKPSAEVRLIGPKPAGFASVRRIPRSWLPGTLSTIWGTVLDGELVEWGDVIAYYDESGGLVGIEFYGSRYGCFVSRDATRCPPWFESLHRLAEEPIFITTRITGGD